MRFDRALHWTGRTLLAMTVGLVLVVACGPETTDPPPGGDVEINITTVGPGRVLQPSSGFVCRGDCTWTGPADEATGFVAAPDGANAFVAWTGACPTLDATCSLLLNDGDATTATFAAHALRLRLTGDGEGEFRIQSHPIDVGCTEDCAVGLPQPLSLAITHFGSAEALRETVREWGGACAGAARSDYCLVPVNGATDVSMTWRRPPVAIAHAYTTPINTPRSVNAEMGVLRGVIDTPGDTHTAVLVDDADGTLVLAADGGFSYTPNPGFDGIDTFTYQARDAFGNLSDVATVTITVTVLDLPVIESFTATPSAITIGSSSTLAWTVTNATSVEIVDEADTVIYSGTALNSTVVTPISTTTYTLTATNTDGNTTATVTVTVLVLPVIESFTADDDIIDIGEGTTLRWNVTGADTITINDGTDNLPIPEDATTVSVTPISTTTYTLTATNTDGNTTATTTITVRIPPVIVSFTADDTTIETGDDTTLRWNITGATTITINDGTNNLPIAPDATTVTVAPTTTTTYTLTATNTDGNTTTTVTVTVEEVGT